LNQFFQFEPRNVSCADIRLHYYSFLFIGVVKISRGRYPERDDYHGGYSSDELLKELEDRGLLTFQNGTWVITQKALAYIAKYHG